MSVANQKIVIINKPSYKRDFLQIGIDEWQEAYKNLKPTSFAIYLYLASNMHGYHFELSKAAIENALNIKKTAYYTAIDELEKQGYLVLASGNLYNFYTTNSANADCIQPQTKNSAKTDNFSAKTDKIIRKNDIEIDNINKIDNDSSPSEKNLTGPIQEKEELSAFKF